MQILKWLAATIFLSAPPINAESRLCEEDASVGFEWTGTSWQKVDFAPQRYLIKRLDEGNEKFAFCLGQAQLEGKTLDVTKNEAGRYFGYGCYTIQTLGSESFGAELCQEAYDEQGKRPIRIVCKNVLDETQFTALGEFFRTSTAMATIDPDLSSRMPIYMAVGKCETLN